jgi:hypothetical protein
MNVNYDNRTSSFYFLFLLTAEFSHAEKVWGALHRLTEMNRFFAIPWYLSE